MGRNSLFANVDKMSTVYIHLAGVLLWPKKKENPKVLGKEEKRKNRLVMNSVSAYKGHTL